MPSLEDFSVEDKPTLDSFGVEKEAKPTNRSSVSNMAANVALLGPSDQIETNFRASSVEMSEGTFSPTADGVLNEARSRGAERARVGLVEVLQDPSLTDADKQTITDEYMADLGYMDVMDMVSEEALVAEGEDFDTDELEFSRGNTAEAIAEINAHKKDMQALINRNSLNENSTTAGKVIDFLEIMVPFTESVQATKVLAEIERAKSNESGIDPIVAISFLGETKKQISEAIRRVPPEQRLELGQALADIINSHENILLPDGNDFAKMELLEAALNVGSYGGVEQFVDNVTSVLDLIGLGGAIRTISKSSKTTKVLKTSPNTKGAPRLVEGATEEVITEQTVSNATRRGTRSTVQPTAPSQNIKDVNPAKARGAHEIAAADDTGEAAKALYGTTRVEAVANDLLPEVVEIAQTVRNKASNIDQYHKRGITPNPEIIDFVENTGELHYWKAEKVQARAEVVHDFRNATGLTTKDEMFQVKPLSNGGVGIRAVYGPAQGGFKDPVAAVEHVKYALRDRGVIDDNIMLLARTGEDYSPTTIKEIEAKRSLADEFRRKKKKIPEELREPIDYKVGVGYDYSFDVSDVTMSGKLDTRFNIFDRSRAFLGDKQGSIQRHVLDPASFLDPKLIIGANVAVDRAAGLEKELSDLGRVFSEEFAKLPTERRGALTDFIKKANAEGIETNIINTKAAGFNDNERDILSVWRELWDTVYWLENRDLNTSLRAQGYKTYRDVGSGTELFVRPVGRSQAGSSVKIYDTENDVMHTLNSSDLSSLYEGGGTIAKMRQPVKVGDEVAEFVSVANESTSSYLRAVNQSDIVLNHRHGYYQVHYKDPKFIVKVEKDSGGNVLFERTIATAGSTKDADHMVKRFVDTDGGEYYHRKDVKGRASDNEDGWDMNVSGGRTAQRIRGKRLEDSSSPVRDTSHEHILDPVEALTKSVRSVSRRTSMRNYLEASKGRMVNQFGHLFPQVNGKPTWPNNIKDIKNRGGVDNKELADARSNYEYVNYLENGYVNAIDDTYKALLNTLGDTLGEAGFAKLEKGALALEGARGPAGFMKSMSFTAYLASNPLRQIIVQSHQALQLFANFSPKYITNASTKTLVLGAKLRGADKLPTSLLKSSGLTQAGADQLFKEYKRSGLHAAVDVNNLVRGDLTQLAETTFAGKTLKAIKTPLTLARKWGFDAGEQANVMTAWLVHREQATGGIHRALTTTEADTVTGLARNFTYNMNAAGDLPYNQNWMNVAFQFLQVPHKALTTMTTNRILSPGNKVKLAAFNTVMYGVPIGTAANILKDILPDNVEVRDALEYGMETVMLNKLISLTTGTDTRIDFSNLAPNDILGFADTLVEILTMKEGIGGIIAGSPSGQLLFGRNPKVTNAFKTAARFFNVTNDYEDPTTFSEVAKDFASISSGFSNMFKARYALKYGQKISTSGSISDEKVTTPEAIASALGFGTLDEAASYKIKDELYREGTAFRKDVTDWYTELKRRLAKQDMSTQEYEYSSRIMSEAWRVFSSVGDVKAKEIVLSLIKKDAKNNDMGLVNNLMNNMGWLNEDDVRRMIKDLPEDQADKRKALLQALDFVSSYKDE